MSEDVAEVFEQYPEEIRRKLLVVRRLIYQTAKSLKEVGPLEETLRWGEPTYLTSKSQSGSMIRIHSLKKSPQRFGVYFHCQTKLVGHFRMKYHGTFHFEGNRGITFDLGDKLPLAQLKDCIAQALTYYL